MSLRVPGIYPTDERDEGDREISLLDPGNLEEDAMDQQLANEKFVIYARNKTGDKVALNNPDAFSRAVQLDPKAWFIIMSKAQLHAGAIHKYRLARDLAKEKARTSAEECREKTTLVDTLDAEIADLKIQIERAEEDKHELSQAEEALTIAKKHIQSQSDQITELRAKLKEAGKKTSLPREKPTNRFIDDLGLPKSIETDDEGEGAVTDSRAYFNNRSVSPSRPVLLACSGEQLEPGTGYNVRFPDPPKVFSGKKSEYKPWKSAVIGKLRESASQYQTAQSGISYIKAWLTGEPWELVDTFIQSNSESSTPKAILSELDEVYLDSNEYVTARAEMETLKQKDDESVEHFLMRFRNINNRMGRSEKDKAVMYDF